MTDLHKIIKDYLKENEEKLVYEDILPKNGMGEAQLDALVESLVEKYAGLQDYTRVNGNLIMTTGTSKDEVVEWLSSEETEMFMDTQTHDYEYTPTEEELREAHEKFQKELDGYNIDSIDERN